MRSKQADRVVVAAAVAACAGSQVEQSNRPFSPEAGTGELGTADPRPIRRSGRHSPTIEQIKRRGSCGSGSGPTTPSSRCAAAGECHRFRRRDRAVSGPQPDQFEYPGSYRMPPGACSPARWRREWMRRQPGRTGAAAETGCTSSPTRNAPAVLITKVRRRPARRVGEILRSAVVTAAEQAHERTLGQAECRSPGELVPRAAPAPVLSARGAGLLRSLAGPLRLPARLSVHVDRRLLTCS